MSHKATQARRHPQLRSRGVAVSGKGVYSEKGREEYFAKLPEATRCATQTMYTQYDALEENQLRHANWTQTRARLEFRIGGPKERIGN